MSTSSDTEENAENQSEPSVPLDPSTSLRIFEEAMLNDCPLVQMEAVGKLSAIALSIGPESTRNDLIPYIITYIDLMSEEVLINVSEQMEKFIPLVGGDNHADLILSVLKHIAAIDEILVRERAIDALDTLIDQMSNETIEKYFLPLIEFLSKEEWFTSKCSASSLFVSLYPKVSQEGANQLRSLFISLLQDQSPIVRRTSTRNFLNFVQVVEADHIQNQFVPILRNLFEDLHEPVKIAAIDVGISIGKKVNNPEIRATILEVLKKFSEESSWRMREYVANKAADFVSFGSTEKILEIYNNAIKDNEPEVRKAAANKFLSFCQRLRPTYENENDFTICFVNNIMPKIRFLLVDPTETVRLAVSANILCFSSILSNECFNENIMPLIVDGLENEQLISFKENILKNFNSLPENIDIVKTIASIKTIIQNLLENSGLHWRIRRNVLPALVHMTKHCTAEYFDSELKIFFDQLLNDSIFAIRRTATIVFPVLIKQFGIDWAKKSLLPVVTIFSKSERYLYRLITLFGINELIFPTLDVPYYYTDNGKYLGSLKQLISNFKHKAKWSKTLIKIIKINEKLQEKIQNENIGDCDIFPNDEASIYAEDTIKYLKSNQNKQIFGVEESQAENEQVCYLEGILFVLAQEYFDIVKNLTNDSVFNVKSRALYTISSIKKFSNIIANERTQEWVSEAINNVSHEELVEIQRKLDEELSIIIEKTNLDTDETIDTSLASSEMSQNQTDGNMDTTESLDKSDSQDGNE